MLDNGYKIIYVLYISANVIESAKQRLGERGSKVQCIVSDFTKFIPPVDFDVWHYRSAFYFLKREDKIYKYFFIAEDAIKKDGYLILGTFLENGPTKCSGLEIRQNSEASMSASFEIAFHRIKCVIEDHTTPFNTIFHWHYLFYFFYFFIPVSKIKLLLTYIINLKLWTENHF